jgi:hypothetical protein
MDGPGFDSLVKALGSGASRRRVLRGVLGSAVAGTAVVSRRWEAQAKPTGCKTLRQCPQGQVCRASTCTTCTGDRPKACPGTLSGDCCPAGEQCCLCPYNSRGETRGGCAPADIDCRLVVTQYGNCVVG